MRTFFIKLISTFFYIGYMPAIPGTFASLAGIGVFYLIRGSSFIYIAVTFLVIVLGFITSAQAERYFQKKDPKYIVIDEVAGMLLSLAFLPYYNAKVIIAAFIIFRILDTLKVYPAGLIQDKKGSFGIMGDDLVAALYTNIILQIVLRLACCNAS